MYLQVFLRIAEPSYALIISDVGVIRLCDLVNLKPFVCYEEERVLSFVYH
jgi:hypothetical protein